jgi:hypothetical protein
MKHGFRKVWELDADTPFLGRAEKVIIINDKKLLEGAEQYRKLNLRNFEVDLLISEAPQTHLNQIGELRGKIYP